MDEGIAGEIYNDVEKVRVTQAELDNDTNITEILHHQDKDTIANQRIFGLFHHFFKEIGPIIG